MKFVVCGRYPRNYKFVFVSLIHCVFLICTETLVTLHANCSYTMHIYIGVGTRGSMAPRFYKLYIGIRFLAYKSTMLSLCGAPRLS